VRFLIDAICGRIFSAVPPAVSLDKALLRIYNWSFMV